MKILYKSSVLIASGLLALLTISPARSDGDQKTKAVVYRTYGQPSVLQLEAVDKPAPGDNQVLIKVRAAAANPLDWHYMRGTPYIMRLDSGLLEPKNNRLGADMAGVVEAVGKAVTKFKPGDEVFGVGPGAFGEYALASERRLAIKPAELTFQDAAAMPIAAITALQALRDKGQIQAGQKVLINGASGGVGTFAVQIAKALGAHVTAVCSTRNVDMVRELGADRVIDYTKQDFATETAQYDVVIDNVGNRDLSDIRAVLKPNGTHVLIGGGGPDDNPWLGPFGGIIGAYLISPFVSQNFEILLADVTTDDLGVLNQMVAEKKLRSVIDRTYPLSETAAAIAYLEEGRARGKVIINVAADP